MKMIPIALAAHQAGDVTTLATCWQITLQNETVFGFTDASQDLDIDGVTYKASTGFTPSSLVTTNTLAVDNMEVQSVLDSDGITEEDLNAGLWDYAEIRIFRVNYADTSMGIEKEMRGHLGEVSSKRNSFVAELRGLTDAYTRMIGELYGPACRANFGDARCGVSLAAHTLTGTVQTVSADGRVVADSARTEAGPAGGRDITGVSQAKEAVVTCPAHGFESGQMVLIAGVAGVTQQGMNGINGRTYVIAVIDTDHFSVPVDTRPLSTDAANGPTDASKVYSPYVSGGVATPAGNTGYFTYGLMTMTSGDSAGLTMEVAAYMPGTITLRMSFPNSIAAGDTYSISAGCGKRFLEDCKTKFQNQINFRGEPHLPGMDQIIVFGGQAPGQGGQ
jgi:uncharacterized phage protein (TIGR02218 family)